MSALTRMDICVAYGSTRLHLNSVCILCTLNHTCGLYLCLAQALWDHVLRLALDCSVLDPPKGPHSPLNAVVRSRALDVIDLALAYVHCTASFQTFRRRASTTYLYHTLSQSTSVG